MEVTSNGSWLSNTAEEGSIIIIRNVTSFCNKVTRSLLAATQLTKAALQNSRRYTWDWMIERPILRKTITLYHRIISFNVLRCNEGVVINLLQPLSFFTLHWSKRELIMQALMHGHSDSRNRHESCDPTVVLLQFNIKRGDSWWARTKIYPQESCGLPRIA